MSSTVSGMLRFYILIKRSKISSGNKDVYTELNFVYCFFSSHNRHISNYEVYLCYKSGQIQIIKVLHNFCFRSL